MLLRDLIPLIETTEVQGDLNIPVREVVADSRTIEEGDVFVAVRGTVVDGHDMIDKAVEAGASAIICERAPESPLSVPLVVTKDTRKAHAVLLRSSRPDILRALKSISFIGITGTNGKTTVATILYDAFRALGKKPGIIGTTGYRFGDTTIPATHTTPDVHKLYSVITQMAEDGVDTIVMEVSSHALEQDRVNGVPFTTAVFTNLTRDHLDYHETMDAYAGAKQRLFSGLSKDSTAVVNADDEYARRMTKNTKASVRSVGESDRSDYTINDVNVAITGNTFTLNSTPIASKLVGRFNVINLALCAAVLKEHGFDMGAIAKALSSITGADGRMEQYTLPNGAVAIVDYAHTPDALENALQTCAPLLGDGGQLRVVFGCGGDRDAGKRPQMGAVAANNAHVAYVTSDNPRTEDRQAIIDDVVEGMVGGSAEVVVEPDRRKAIEVALTNANPGDIVVVAGKGHEQFQILGTERVPMSDSAEIERFVSTNA